MVCCVFVVRDILACQEAKLSSLSTSYSSVPSTMTVTRAISLKASSAVPRMVSSFFSVAEITLGKTMLASGGSSSSMVWMMKLPRSEEHTSELQSRGHLVCRLLLEKKNHQ